MSLHPASSVLAAAASSDLLQSPTSMLTPAGTPAHDVFGLSMLVYGITGAIFLIVGGLLLFALFRFRHKRTEELLQHA